MNTLSSGNSSHSDHVCVFAVERKEIFDTVKFESEASKQSVKVSREKGFGGGEEEEEGRYYGLRGISRQSPLVIGVGLH